MSSSGSTRMRRVAERIRADLSELLIRGAIRDPEIQDAVVTGVEVTSDLSVARIYLRRLDTDADEDRRKRMLDAMKRAGGHLRRELARTLGVRRVPELRFVWDDAADRAARLEQIFGEIHAERDGQERGK